MKFPRAHTWLDWDAKFGRFAPLLLLVWAVIYYGSYLQSGLNLGGEGGTNAVVAMRILEGQRPIVDTFLGYNLMWFYPLVWLFELTGPSYLAMKYFFLALCTATAFLSYFSLARFTRIHALSFGVALLPLMLPGMMFRNYMGFIGVLNLFLLLGCYVSRGNEGEKGFNGMRAFWFCAAGLGLGLTFLIRIDLGIFFTAMYLGGAVLAALIPREATFQRMEKLIGGWVVIPLLAFLLHLPFYLHAKQNDFGEAFADQYQMWGSLIVNNFEGEIQKLIPAPKPVSKASVEPVGPVVVEKAVESAPSSPPVEKRSSSALFPRANVSDIWTLPRGYDRMFVWSLYLPMVISPLIFLLGLGLLVAGLRKRDADDYELGLGLVLGLGSALTLWPQYYFFRPDLPHLSEFMVPFYVSMGLAVYVLFRLMSRRFSWIVKGAFIFLLLLCLFNGIAYPYYAVPKDTAGGSAANRGRFSEFEGENGVHVLLKDWERDGVQALYEVIMKYSDTDDFITVYPYSPTILLMTDRRSYEYNLYVDNATATADFFDQAIHNIQEKKPAVVVIDNRDINKSDESRFENWAKPLRDYIRQNYVTMGEFGRRKLEVYVRPDKFQAVHAGDVISPQP